MDGDASVKMQFAQQLGNKRILLVPGTNTSTMDVNRMVSHLMVRRGARASGEAASENQPAEASRAPHAGARGRSAPAR